MQSYLSKTHLEQLEKRQRTKLINSISGFKSLNLIGTINEACVSNLAIFNSVVHLGAHPALIGFIARPDSVERHTLENIEKMKYYTINHVSQTIYRQAHQTSARYPAGQSEFEEAGLTADYKNSFIAPYVKESAIQMGMEFKQRVDIDLNGTSLIIGEVVQLYFPANCLCQDGYLDIEKGGTLAGSSLDGYHETRRVARLSYAKPDLNLSNIISPYTE